MSKQMLVLALFCPQCQAPLTEGTRFTLDGYVLETHQDGAITLSAIFGDYTLESEMEIPAGAIMEFRCPRCEASVMLPSSCKLCKAPMASLNLETDGYIEFCSRRGCKGHAVGGVGDIDQMMNLMNRMFETPYD